MNKPQELKDLETIRDTVKSWKGDIEKGYNLSVEINQKLDDFSTKLKNIQDQNNIQGSNDKPADGLDVEELLKEVEKLKAQITEYNKVIAEVKGHVDTIGDKPQKWREETEKAHKGVGEVITKALALIGVLSMVYLIFQGTKNFFFKRK